MLSIRVFCKYRRVRVLNAVLSKIVLYDVIANRWAPEKDMC